MSEIKDIDVIVIGAGPAGVSCAITVARKNYKVLVIEKSSNFGVKNMFGGEVYLESLKELLPDSYKEIPYERLTVQNNYVILDNKSAVSVSYNEQKEDAATITRYNFDTFLAVYARKLGVYFVNNTLCTDIIKENGKVTGVKTENEVIKCKIAVIAEGFNSILSEKIGLKKKTEPKDAILGVKEVIKLDKKIINERFNLKDNEGAMFQFFGGLSDNETVPFGMGFLYTFKNFITVGLGISMEDLKNGKIPPYEYLEKLKAHPFVSKLIDGGEVVEYSAHSIPEGGYNKLPKLYDDGVLLAGDAAGLVDSVHFEGTNLGIKSGIIAGETCDYALNKNDFSSKTLKMYKNELFKSFVIKDMKTYKDVIDTLYKRKKSVFKYYPNKVNEFFKLFTSSDNKGKKQGYQAFIKSFLKRNPIETIKDITAFIKCILGAIL